MKKTVVLLTMVVFLVLALSGVALAATAQDIYDDYAPDLKLDGAYTSGELQAYLSDATVHQYGNSAVVSSLDTIVSSMLTEERSNFPFTGAQIAMMVAGALLMIGGGIGLRRLARSHS